jgi:hypothetical protein
MKIMKFIKEELSLALVILILAEFIYELAKLGSL